MLEREDLRQVRSVVKDVLREGHLDKLPDLFGREHHKHRGTHDLTFRQLVDAPDYIDNRQFITIVNEDEDGVAFIDLLGTDHQIVVTKNPLDFTLSLHHQVHVYSAEEAPRVRVTNLSDTLDLDPVFQYGLGPLDSIQFTHGVDDSDSNKWKISNLSALGTLAETQGAFSERLVFVHGVDSDIDYVDLSDFSTDGVYVSTTRGTGDGQLCTTPKSLAYDGVYLYEADDTNNRVQKFDAASGAFVSKLTIRRPWGLCHWNGVLYCLTSTAALSGGVWYYQLHIIDPDTMTISSTYDYEQGTADDELSVPRGMCTDGTNLFIGDSGNRRIKKTSLAGIYVNKVGSAGTGNGQFGASGPSDCEVDDNYLYVCDYGNKRIQVFDKSTMVYVGQHATQTVGGVAGSPASIAINDTCYYVGCHNATPYPAYIEKYDIATRTYQATYDTIVIAQKSDVLWGLEIAKFASSLTKYGDLVVVHQDGSYIDHWPICRFVDDIRLVEDGDLADGDYVGLRAPATVTASYSLTFPAALPAGTSHVYSTGGGQLGFGQDVNVTASPTFVMLTLNQGAADDHILVVKSSDIAHGMTALEETDTYGSIIKYIATTGGMVLSGFTEASVGVNIRGHYTTGDTTKTTSSLAPVQLAAGKKSGTSGTGDPGANENIVAMRKYDGGAGHTLWILDEDGDTWQEGSVTGTVGIFNIAIGTAPMTITSTTVVANLNVDQVDGKHETAFVLIDGTRALTASWDVGSFEVRAQTFQSDVATGTAPFTVASTTAVTNLNADLWDGIHKASLLGLDSLTDPAADRILFWDDSETLLKWLAPGNSVAITVTTLDTIQDIRTSAGPSFDHLHLTVAIGTAPLVVTSTTMVANLNADLLDGSHAAAFAAVTHYHDSDYISIIAAPAANHFPYQTAGGELIDSGYDAADFAAAAHAVLSATHGDSAAAVVQEGDIIYGISPLPGWPYRKRIDLPIPDANLTGFPNCIKIVADAEVGAGCLANGHDIRFTAADGTTLLSYEREVFSGGGGAPLTAIIWVKSNVSTAGTYVWIYYGNVAAADGENATAVWDAAAKAVYHMNDLTTSTIKDSTANANNGTKTAANNPAEVDGKIGKGQDFNGEAGSGHIDCGSGASLNGADELTVEAWINYDGVGQDHPGVVTRLTTSASGYYVRIDKAINRIYLSLNWAGGYQNFPATTPLVRGSWGHVAFTYKASTLKVNTFRDGAPEASQDATNAMVNATNSLVLGDLAGWYLDGLLDEIRISAVARSAAWIKYEYANMAAADGGLTWGEEEATARWTRLPKGTAGQVLKMVSGLPAWATP